MVGTLPETKLLVINGDLVQGVFDSYYEVGLHVGVSVDDKGQIFLKGVKQYPEYIVKGSVSSNAYVGFTSEEAVGDWVKCYLHKKSTYRVYRILT